MKYKYPFFLSVVFVAALATAASAQTRVTPRVCDVSTVVTGGAAVVAISGPANGYYILNPLTAADQGIGAAEVIYVNTVSVATTSGAGSNVALSPGQSFYGVGGSTLPVSVNAASSGHVFTCVRW